MKSFFLKSLILSLILLKINPACSKTGVSEDANTAKQALIYLNAIRHELKLPVLIQNPALQKSAAGQATYQVVNNQQGHQQASNLLQFTGEWPNDRAYASGYHSHIAEVISYNSARPTQFIDDLMSAIYHRLSLLDMGQNEVGVSVVRDDEGFIKSALVANLGNKHLNQACQTPYTFANGTVIYTGLCKNAKPLAQSTVEKIQQTTAQLSPKILVWPKSGATVQPVFYEENPDPLPQCNVSGYPVHIQVNPNYWGKIHFKPNSFTLVDLDSGVSIPAISIFNNLSDPHTKEDKTAPERWWAYFPQERLAWGRRYQAQVQWVEQGQTKTTRWEFFTPKLQGLNLISSAKTTLKAQPGETLHLYFPPSECNAQPSADVQTSHTPNLTFKTEFVDVQTLKITLGERKGNLRVIYQPTQSQVIIKVR